MGPLVKHGFARISPWTLDGVEAVPGGGVEARFSLTSTEAMRATWPHDFKLEYGVRLGGRSLNLTLGVANMGEGAFDFRAALHTYLRIAKIEQARLVNLQGACYLEGGSQAERVQAEAVVAFSEGEFNRVYLNPPTPILVNDGERRVEVAASGFPDVVVWNPGAERGAGLPDMEPGGYQQMVCVEAAIVKEAVTLAAGSTWRGEQTLRA
jgi:glucose-6-phosphate 1-epimerase